MTWVTFYVITSVKIDVFLLREAQFRHDGIQQIVCVCSTVTRVMFLVITSVKIDIFSLREAQFWHDGKHQTVCICSSVTWVMFYVITIVKIEVFLLREAQFLNGLIQQTVWEFAVQWHKLLLGSGLSGIPEDQYCGAWTLEGVKSQATPHTSW